MSVLSLLDIIDESPSIDTPLIFNDNIYTSNVKNLLLIDSIVSESQLFFDSSNTNTFPIIYSNNSNRDDFIKLLEDKFSNGLERIAFVFHDNIKDGKAFLNQELFFSESDIKENINSYSSNTQLLIDVTKKYGVKNIDFLACNSLNYQNWIKFYDILSKETGVIVGASNDKTGNLKSGGDWIMENTNENVVSTYFNNNIENYASTLASTITQNGGIIYIQQSGNNIQYQSNSTSGSWTTFSSWPVTFVNSNNVAENILTISLTTNLSISNTTVGTGTNGYFITGSSYITYDGTGKTVTIDTVSNYTGLIQNGTSGANGYSNVTVKNINNAISGSSILVTDGGWICQSYFGKAVNNIVINNCSNSAIISNNGSGGICGSNIGDTNGNVSISNCSNSGINNGTRVGGICGRFAGNSFGNVSISNCSNTGNNIGERSAGICGQQAGSNNGTVSITNCTNNGIISGNLGGGICSGFAGFINGNVIITNCSNTGAISCNLGGGICGTQAGQENGKISIKNCSNSGIISSKAGGICGGLAGILNGSVSITNCTNNGIISGNLGGGITCIWFGYNSNNLCSIINCYNTGAISGSNAGGITGAEIGYNDNAIYTPKILIQNCYSLGNIATTSGGICGGTEGNVYTNIPVVNITNCYTAYNSIIDSGSQYISTSLQTAVRNAIILTNVYSSLLSSWSDTNANNALYGSLSIFKNSRLYKYYSNFGAVWYSNQNNTPFNLTSFLNTVPRRKRINNIL
jgi:hypothetical protein